MRIDEYNYFTLGMTREEKDVLHDTCLYYCQCMEENMSGEEDMVEETYEAIDHLNDEEIHYYDLECYYNALNYWIDTNEEDPNIDPIPYYEKKGLAEKMYMEIARYI